MKNSCVSRSTSRLTQTSRITSQLRSRWAGNGSRAFAIWSSVQVAIVLVCVTASAAEPSAEIRRSVPLQAEIDSVQPMTGVVLWHDHEEVATDAISLEFRYCGYDEDAVGPGQWDFTAIEKLLDEIASRSHQAVLRFRFVYPGKKTTVPQFILDSPGYNETVAKSEGKKTYFCDWSHEGFQQFVLDFYTEFASRYDNDPRIAYLQTGFGLWSEYHIYDGPMKLGDTFPSEDFQSKFLKHLDQQFDSLPWMISIDAADDEATPIANSNDLLALEYGLFDDSFLSKEHSKWNAENWRAFGNDRWQRQAGGGEFNYYTRRDQKLALSPNGPHGVSVEDAVRQFHISFMIGNDQPSYQTMPRIQDVSMSMGYRFRVTNAEAIKRNGQVSLELQVTNEGVAPIYRNAYFEMEGVRSNQSLRGLLPGETRTCTIDRIASRPTSDNLKIVSDAILPNQAIQFSADLK
ncbi:DUF4832 domain-containing protein [Rhodopirellula sp. JC740]|uniref:DUF4832 domain-containing protein n=1 Tax=Rhodopirellula halodulae TaxID=2894198 RepID=A0ABS8NMF0_9BACT|nr:DUF4832 domain-containing protein [Rhodopirellula sp. JC740]MCC9644764.1 DUF4832 domain-containing protein [Rhodopirellula sp. JC740]